MTGTYTKSADTVIATEKQHIQSGRQRAKLDLPENEMNALAFSGGGIRSASFCLGILQALANGGVLKKMDYLSTSSGGGYLGASLTWFLSRKQPDGKPYGTEPHNFPFGHTGIGARNFQDGKNPNSILDFIRQHGKYLTPGHGLDFISFIGSIVRTVFVSLLVYFSFLSLIMIGLQVVHIHGIALFDPVSIIKNKPALPNLFFLGAAVSSGLFLVTSLLYSIHTRFAFGFGEKRYAVRVDTQIVMAYMIKFGIAFIIIGSLPIAHDYLRLLEAHIAAAGTSTLTGTAMAIYRLRSMQRAKSASSGNDLLMIAACSFTIYGLLLGAFILASNLFSHNDLPVVIAASALLLIIVLLFGFFVNSNYLGIHRCYRDRLMEAFMPNPGNIAENCWGMATDADKGELDAMSQAPNERPYHLINTNLVLVDSQTTKYRGRGGDNFILSPLYCGSDATGWRTSSDYKDKHGRGVSLPSAMAISGASFNPNTGNSGRGVTRNRWVSALFGLLNIRLGYWAINPERDQKKLWTSNPNFIYPGLVQGVLGGGLKQDKKFLELSDGGHFDNLGFYELVRRGCKTIIICDGGADPDFIFDDLGNAIERARVDFGANVRFDNNEFPLTDVQPESGGDTPSDKKYNTAKRGFAIANIYYNDGSKGTLIYIKATMTRNLSADIYSYKSAHPAFPHEPTADQFFDEVQTEAYRELGYYLGWQMLEANGHADASGKMDLKKSSRWI